MQQSNIEYIVATHWLVYGAPQAFCDYLIKQKIPSFFSLSHSLNAEPDSPSQLVHYRDGAPQTLASHTIPFKGQLLKTIVEMLMNLFWVMRRIPKRTSSDVRRIFIGVNPINAFCGVLLKKLGYVDAVIFYTIDYVPIRHPNPWINAFYHAIDRCCFKAADAVWNVSTRINEGRLSNGYKTVARKNVQVVPIGVWPSEPSLCVVPRKKNQIVFIGHLLEKQGVQYVLDAMPLIIAEIPDIVFLIIGGGEYEAALKAQVERLGLQPHVVFTGWVKNRAEAERLLEESELALAPYDKALDTFTYYADPTKLKDYLTCGLPIILTDVPHNAYDIQEKKCGVVVELSAESIAKAVKKLLGDRPRLLEMREHTKDYIRSYSWERIFSHALQEFFEGKKL